MDTTKERNYATHKRYRDRNSCGCEGGIVVPSGKIKWCACENAPFLEYGSASWDDIYEYGCYNEYLDSLNRKEGVA